MIIYQHKKHNEFLFLVSLLLLILSSCGSNTPEETVVGTWLMDYCPLDNSVEEVIMIIDNVAGKVYDITIHTQSKKYGNKTEKLSGVMKELIDGSSVIVINRNRRDNKNFGIEIYPKENKIRYVTCWFTKQ